MANIVDQNHRIHGLLHDAPEAIVGDVSATWKNSKTKTDEEWLLCLIYDELGIELPSSEAYDAVKQADLAALAAEAHALGHRQAEIHWPKAEWTEQTHHAFRLTTANIARDVTRNMLIAETAIQVFQEALGACGVDVEHAVEVGA